MVRLLLHAAAFLLLLSSRVALAGECRDVDKAVEEVRLLVEEYEGKTSLVDAYDRSAAAWFCAHPDAQGAEIASWLETLPRTADGPTLLTFGAEKIVLHWGGDVGLGGRLSIYSRAGGEWLRTGFFDAEPSARLTVLARFTSSLVVAEVLAGGDASWSTIRALRLDGDRFVEAFVAPDLLEVRSKMRKGRLVLRYHRLPHGFGVRLTRPRLAFDLIVEEIDGRVESTTKSRSPELELLEAVCAPQGAASAARHVRPERLLAEMPTCRSMILEDAHRRSESRTDFDVTGVFPCAGAEGERSASSMRGVITVEKGSGGYAITAIKQERRQCEN
jgi:hypothetical protein